MRVDKTYKSKLSEKQKRFIETAVGYKFLTEFVWRHGNHCYNISNTGGGKTQRNYWLVDWLRHTENIIWLSTGKSDEILPLLFMDCGVRIIIPKDADFEIDGINEAPVYPEIVEVSSPGEAWNQVLTVFDGSWKNNSRNKLYNKITIFEFRNTLSLDIRSKWMAELFIHLSEWSREGTMPSIFPCAIFLDESQWVLAGTRITTDQTRTKTAEVITENALEMRSKGCRFIFTAQDYKNVTPASREQMLCAILGRGANVSTEENSAWSRACGDARTGVSNTSTFKREYARFVFDDGRFYPLTPWKFPLFPLNEEDRERLRSMSVLYGRKFSGKTQEEEEQAECFPELGRFSALAVPREKEDVISRFDIPVLYDE